MFFHTRWVPPNPASPNPIVDAWDQELIGVLQAPLPVLCISSLALPFCVQRETCLKGVTSLLPGCCRSGAEVQRGERRADAAPSAAGQAGRGRRAAAEGAAAGVRGRDGAAGRAGECVYKTRW